MMTPWVRDNFISALETRFAYADGIMVASSPIGIYKSVMKAKVLTQDADEVLRQRNVLGPRFPRLRNFRQVQSALYEISPP